ncbi:hydrolase, hydrolyzing O-glycosyl compound [Dorcoceras hygrometricum]|uniref:Hydrolase, hydrolyzing O-glycosyl compound n=1 Tax=Dorcoceras hygrometricum TaxID=472368 RepID=A0A2Z7D1I6_9LAMI|nr:hydrolase, hydrolyzing O-glycosyl compound [Dorcoceras hygrometricum]
MRSYSDQQEDSADEKRCARYEMSCDDISLDVITISSWQSADEAKRERRSDVVLRFSRWISADYVIGDVITFSRWFERPVARISRCYLEIAIAKRCRLHKWIRQRFALALKIQQMLFAMRKFSRDFSQEKPAGSNNIQSRANISAVATHPVARSPGAKN